jgi:hypothetical protein
MSAFAKNGLPALLANLKLTIDAVSGLPNSVY